MTAVLKGLVLSGGRSTRMQRDKAVLEYGGETQLDRAMRLLGEQVAEVFVSVRADQASEPARAKYRQIVDSGAVQGPTAGILAAQAADPQAAWLVLACDLPQLDAQTLATLIAGRDPQRTATAFHRAHGGLPEPLCTVYEPASAPLLAAFVATGRDCPRKFLLNSDTLLLDQPNPKALDNVNTPDEFKAVSAALAAGGEAREIRVQYFALLREQARCSEETVQSTAATPRELFAELTAHHGFTLPADMLKVAINTEFADWSQPLKAGDAVVFIPPVAGG